MKAAPANGNAREQAGADTTTKHARKCTRFASFGQWIWFLGYRAEEARQNHRNRGNRVRHALCCIALALLRLVGQ